MKPADPPRDDPPHDTIDAAVKRGNRYYGTSGDPKPHHFEYGPGGSPYCKVCGAAADGFYHRGVQP